MWRRRQWLTVALLIIGSLGLALWLASVVPKVRQASAITEPTRSEAPVRLEEVKGTDLKRVILSQRAAERLGIETAQIREEQVSGTPRKVVPYDAVLYGTKGETWAYTNPSPLVFVRQSISIERIEGDRAILKDGPPAGTTVVKVGAAELFGAEFGVGH